jgi:hypothetical protein
MSPVKLVFIGPLFMKLAPHFFALSEMKTRTNAASNLLISNYEVFEEKAVCDPGADDLSLNFWPCLTDVV